jgi:perosamine synthetase
MIGFIEGHNYLGKPKLNKIKTAYQGKASNNILKFESEFADLIGTGEVVSFASARMGFFALMKIFGIKSGDEIILCGSTCSVMANAILRIGATPIYCDIDIDTLGSCATSIKENISNKTKIVVAQHSFGIPCNIEDISKICLDNKILLIEDCALALGSKYKNKNVGTFGDAAIFSTDHSKPINTLIGGLVYSNSSNVIKKAKDIQKKSDNLPAKKKKALYIQFTIERLFAKPKTYGVLSFINSIYGFLYKHFGVTSPFLDDDADTFFINENYSYPSKMPEFIALIGLYEINRWKEVSNKRKESLNYLKIILENSLLRSYLPKAYYDNNRNIIPLRFAFSHPDAKKIEPALKSVVDFDLIWFKEPIINSKVPLNKFLYTKGTCPIAEKIGPNMINLPLAEQKIIDFMINKIANEV